MHQFSFFKISKHKHSSKSTCSVYFDDEKIQTGLVPTGLSGGGTRISHMRGDKKGFGIKVMSNFSKAPMKLKNNWPGRGVVCYGHSVLVCPCCLN